MGGMLGFDHHYSEQLVADLVPTLGGCRCGGLRHVLGPSQHKVGVRKVPVPGRLLNCCLVGGHHVVRGGAVAADALPGKLVVGVVDLHGDAEHRAERLPVAMEILGRVQAVDAGDVHRVLN